MSRFLYACNLGPIQWCILGTRLREVHRLGGPPASDVRPLEKVMCLEGSSVNEVPTTLKVLITDKVHTSCEVQAVYEDPEVVRDSYWFRGFSSM